MQKKVIATIIMLSMILFSINFVSAASGSVSLNASNTSAKPGETFTITLAANCADGINGIDTTFSYDKDKLELISENVSSNKWANLGENGGIQVICNTSSKVTSDDIYVLTFKVKDNATAGTTAKISTTEISVESDIAASSFTEPAKTININITGNTSNSNTPNTENTNGNESDSKAPTTDSKTPTSDSQTSTSNSTTSTDKNGTSKVDKSVNKTNLPKTGKNDTIIIAFIILACISTIISYIKMVKNNK